MINMSSHSSHDKYTINLEFTEYDEYIATHDKVYEFLRSLEREENANNEKCCHCKRGAEEFDAENDVKFNPANFATLNSEPLPKTPELAWILPLFMPFINSGNHDGYLKGKCDAYEKIFAFDDQEENMQKFREALAELKKSLGNNDIPKSTS